MSSGTALIVRGHVVYATGTVAAGPRGTTALALTPVRTVRPGTYTLTVRRRRGRRVLLTRRTIELMR